MEVIHYTVLKQEVVDYLQPQPGDLGVDCTTGEGGHSLALLQSQPGLKLICLDADPAIQERARVRLAAFGDRVEFVHTWFDDFFGSYSRDVRPNLILADLGISSFHYEASDRGFSFRGDEALDMRLNPLTEKSAADLVNELAEETLADLIYEYGEESFSRRIARAIVTSRRQEPVRTAKQLADTIWEAVPVKFRHGRIHPATKTFQALRIAVNAELDRLGGVLEAAFKVLAPGGRMGIITFHSLEDRLVKNFFREQAKVCICPPSVARCKCGSQPAALDLTRKPVVPTETEIQANAASRSAKLRVVKKIGEWRERIE